MYEITKFLVNSGTHFLFSSFKAIHINATDVNKIKGKVDSTKSLKIEFDSNNSLIIESEIKQSKDKKVCLGSPKLITGFRELIRLSGNLSSKDSEVIINCI